MKSYYKGYGSKLQQCHANEFVEFWNRFYTDDDKPYYNSLYDQSGNLTIGLTEENIKKLLWWKFRPLHKRFYNPAVAVLSSINRFRHLTSIAQEEERNFWQKTRSVSRGGIVMQAFLFHVSRPHDYAILDRHAMRAYIYMTESYLFKGDHLQGLYPYDSFNKFYSTYRPYTAFFFQAVVESGYSHDPKAVDRALWAFGKHLEHEG